MQFDNIDIENSQRHGIQLVGNGFDNITFNNVIINGTGLDAVSRDVPKDVYGGLGIMAQANGGSVTFNQVSISNYENLPYLNRTNSFDLNIIEGDLPLQGIDITQTSLELAAGESKDIDLTFNPPQATNKNVTWNSSAPNVVRVSANGSYGATLVAQGVGSAIITATSAEGSYTDNINVSVSPAVTIQALQESVVEGDTAQFRISAADIGSAVSIAYTVSGSASASDYNASPILDGVVELAPGNTEQLITINTLDDSEFESTENLVLTLNAGNGYRVGEPASASLAINDNELPSCEAPVVARTNTVPVVDNNIDSVWSAAPVSAINNLTFGSLPAGVSGQWRALASADALHVLVEVTDGNRFNDSSNWWDDDVVELFIDADNSKATSYDGNDFQLGFRWGDNSIHVGGSSATNATGITHRQYATAVGYNLEVSIPWSTLGVNPADGEQIGFDVALDVDDNGGARDAQLTSLAATGTGWSDPSVFGSVYITDCNGNDGGDDNNPPTNHPPVVDAGNSQVLTAGTGAYDLRASASDSDGDPLTVSWSQVSGTPVSFDNPASLNAQVYNLSDGGSYVLRLSVSDGDLTTTDDVQISVTTDTNPAASYYIINRWQDSYLYDAGTNVGYSGSAGDATYEWTLDENPAGAVVFHNVATGDAMNIENFTGTVQATAVSADWDSAKWQLEDVDGTHVRVRNVWQSNQYIHVENLTGSAQHGTIYPSWWSAQWELVPVNP